MKLFKTEDERLHACPPPWKSLTRSGGYWGLVFFAIFFGTALFNVGDYDESLTAFQHILDDFPDSEYVESSRQNIDICRKRLGAGVVEENPPDSGDSESDVTPGAEEPTEGEPQ